MLRVGYYDDNKEAEIGPRKEFMMCAIVGVCRHISSLYNVLNYSFF